LKIENAELSFTPKGSCAGRLFLSLQGMFATVMSVMREFMAMSGYVRQVVPGVAGPTAFVVNKLNKDCLFICF